MSNIYYFLNNKIYKICPFGASRKNLTFFYSFGDYYSNVILYSHLGYAEWLAHSTFGVTIQRSNYLNYAHHKWNLKSFQTTHSRICL